MKAQDVYALNEYEGALLLKEWGIPVVDQELARDAEEAREAALRLGFPVALKVCSEKVLHKTDLRGVVLGIADENSLYEAARDILERFRDVNPGLLVQKRRPQAWRSSWAQAGPGLSGPWCWPHRGNLYRDLPRLGHRDLFR